MAKKDFYVFSRNHIAWLKKALTEAKDVIESAESEQDTSLTHLKNVVRLKKLQALIESAPVEDTTIAMKKGESKFLKQFVEKELEFLSGPVRKSLHKATRNKAHSEKTIQKRVMLEAAIEDLKRLVEELKK